MSYSEHEEDGVTRQLRAIQAGGHHLVALARRRVAELLDELDKGDFQTAYNVAQKIEDVLTPLASAQGYIAIADGARLVKARELEPGMVLVDVGEVTEVDVRDCDALRCDGHVAVKIGDHEGKYHGNTELYVEDKPEETDGVA